MHYPEPILKLIESYSRLPGIGQKTAARLAFFILKMEKEDVVQFAQALIEAKEKLKPCTICGYITDEEICYVCKDKGRDTSIVCVVQETKDVIAMEKMREYGGLYHVLNGVISPIEGIGPEDINLPSLIKRLYNPDIKELIVATNPTVEGEATAMYLSRLLRTSGVDMKVTRIAHGLPVGGDLEYADEVTLMKAIEGRREI
ncbi:MAG: recombination mediator RecR [Bacilli bacterium]